MAQLDQLSDYELLSLLKKDDQQALAEIFGRYWAKLLAIALNRLSNLEEAEECVQDVLLKLWKLRKNLELRYTLYTYLAAATRYRVLDLLDSQYRKTMQTEPLEDHAGYIMGTVTADAELLEKELIARIEEAVGQLPEKCQVVYRLSREDGLSNKHIAAELNISEKTVEAHLTKAIKNLRDGLSTSMPAIFLLAAGLYECL